MFQSKIHAYLQAILTLNNLAQKSGSTRAIRNATEKIKITVENHEQDVSVVTDQLRPFTPKHPDIQNLILEIEKTQEDQRSLQEKYENIHARFFEHALPFILLQSPTQCMMQAVYEVSQQILDTLDQCEHCEDIFIERSHIIAFGAFQDAPTLDQLKNILQENNPENLITIMLIHFRFAQNLMSKIEKQVNKKPSGKIAEMIEQKRKKQAEDKEKIDAFDFDDPYHYQAFDYGQLDNARYDFDHFFHFRPTYNNANLIDKTLYESELFTCPGERGRDGSIFFQHTNQMSLLTNTQEEHEKYYLKHASSWVADVKAQKASLESPCVKDLIDHDTVYVAGPSGMTTIFMGLMENFTDLDLAQKQHYIAAVMAYIVSGGFHGIHEVLAVPAWGLDFIPDYPVNLPGQEAAIPPQFYAFYKQLINSDPEFKAKRNQSWNEVLTKLTRANLLSHDIFIPRPESVKITIKDDDSIRLPDEDLPTAKSSKYFSPGSVSASLVFSSSYFIFVKTAIVTPRLFDLIDESATASALTGIVLGTIATLGVLFCIQTIESKYLLKNLTSQNQQKFLSRPSRFLRAASVATGLSTSIMANTALCDHIDSTPVSLFTTLAIISIGISAFYSVSYLINPCQFTQNEPEIALEKNTHKKAPARYPYAFCLTKKLARSIDAEAIMEDSLGAPLLQ